MSTRPVTECAEEALRKLGVVSSGQPIPAEDGAAASVAVQQALLEMEARVYATLEVSDEIDALYYDAVAMYAAALLAPNYGTATINGMTPDQVQEMAVRKVFRLRPRDEPTDPIPTNYF